LDVAKDVSAFANSGGGVIIYGVRTDVDKTLPVDVEGIESRNIETFDRIVNAHIRPEIPGLQRRVLIRDNLTLMVVHVPQSDEAPHQSLTDHRYYRRAGAESLPMEHDLVELYFGRRRSPVLAVETEVNRTAISGGFDDDGLSDEIGMRLFLVNRGRRVARYANVIFTWAKAAVVIQSRGAADNARPSLRRVLRIRVLESRGRHPSRLVDAGRRHPVPPQKDVVRKRRR
jgi:hypothetical protein